MARQAHIPAFMRVQRRAQLVAVCDKNADCAITAAKQFGIPRVYSDLTELLSSEKLDILDVCTPPAAHFAIVMSAVRAGINVLVEKPLALTVPECDTLIDEATRRDVKVCVVHNNLFHPTFRKLHLMVKAGEIGNLLAVNISLAEPRSAMISVRDHWVHSLPGGVLMETGPHAVYMLLAISGIPMDIHALGHSNLHLPWAPFDEFRIALGLEDSIGSISLSYSGVRWRAKVEAIGTEGTIESDLRGCWCIRYRSSSANRMSQFKDAIRSGGTVLGGISSVGLKSVLGRTKYGHDYIVEKFVECVLQQNTVPVTLMEARDTVMVLNSVISKLHGHLREAQRNKAPVASLA